MGTRVLAFRLWETVPTWSHPLLPPFSRRIDCLVRLLEWEWLDILVKKKKKKGHETYVSKIFFLSLFISFFFFRSPVVLGQECKVRYRSVAFKQVFEGLEGLSLSTRETNSRRTGENVRNPHSFGGIARFVIFFPNSLSLVEAEFLGSALSLSLSLREFRNVENFGAYLVATGQRKRARWYAHRYPVPSWNLSVKLFRASRVSDLPLWIRNVVFFHTVYDSIAKEEEEREKERGKKSIRRTRERENNGVNEPWTTSTRNSRMEGRPLSSAFLSGYGESKNTKDTFVPGATNRKL